MLLFLLLLIALFWLGLSFWSTFRTLRPYELTRKGVPELKVQTWVLLMDAACITYVVYYISTLL